MPNTVEYYRAKGLDQKSAEYFAHGRRKIVSVAPNSDFTLTIGFDNGEKRLFDVSSFLKKGTVFEPLMKPEIFNRAYVDEQHAISWDIDPEIDSRKVWSNKIDLCPDTCYIDSKPL